MISAIDSELVVAWLADPESIDTGDSDALVISGSEFDSVTRELVAGSI